MNSDCIICFESYNDSNRKPHTLIPCGHTICGVCLESINNCPECRMLIERTVVSYALIPSPIFQNLVQSSVPSAPLYANPYATAQTSGRQLSATQNPIHTKKALIIYILNSASQPVEVKVTPFYKRASFYCLLFFLKLIVIIVVISCLISFINKTTTSTALTTTTSPKTTTTRTTTSTVTSTTTSTVTSTTTNTTSSKGTLLFNLTGHALPIWT